MKFGCGLGQIGPRDAPSSKWRFESSYLHVSITGPIKESALCKMDYVTEDCDPAGVAVPP